MNPARDVDPGAGAPGLFTAVVEIPKGSKNKYELDERTGMLRLDRVLSSSVRYPANYGLIPRTLAPDGDPLDVIVLGQEEVPPLTLMTVKPVGVLYVSSGGTTEPKIIAVDATDPQYKELDAASRLPPHLMTEIENFFESYKVLEGQPGAIEGVGGANEAVAVIAHALKAYKGRPRKKKKWRH